ncbi:conserved Plasmodium protein, unknown function [Plasmodium berghei]|uniref:Uncharacterized protein n=3 Tax=Plasmodium berghei TaxID=5821 RepID=A0A509AGY1_PLABA|nr:conserved Plasmodium protein, unknown function [Plasmodium berghei ANKA]CXH92282.1 conserved Plasmodium protein, unknown function [Plasmodium berghei]SCM15322.1 conserved Plasmodium protein, unknown function [Plasmodium berghei]SCM17114.1 conserved Plasmodium protein, unknown function [Plasmodium berghei]SCN22097.1 conserved Plasmodium protein, unknown function [Plasmodium berghei]VUC54060.1 conserved Plasmodium protein, unknown function [Plasmodium berghei ANKA]|eukprot:XP_034419905.1 conserved Plasmodium protein, unknown function [Plasmodium berghei ANKA]
MYNNKMVNYEKEEKKRTEINFIKSEKYHHSNNDFNKNIEKINTEKCERASILLDNMSALDYSNLNNGDKRSDSIYSVNWKVLKTNELNYMNSGNIGNDKYKRRSLTCNNFTNNIFDSSINENKKLLYEIEKSDFKDINQQIGKTLINSYSDYYLENEKKDWSKFNKFSNYNMLDLDTYNNEDIDIPLYKDKTNIIIDNGKNDDNPFNNRLMNFQKRKHVKNYNGENIKFELLKENKDDYNGRNNIFYRPDENVNKIEMNRKRIDKEDKYIFNLKSGKKERIDVKLCKDKNKKDVKKNIISEWYNNSEENNKMFENKMKTEFDIKLNKMIEKYRVQDEEKKEVTNIIYKKYMNIKNGLIKESYEKKKLKDENEKLKNELMGLIKPPIENNMIYDYKKKLENYMYLSKNKDIEVKKLENELINMKNKLNVFEKEYLDLSSEKKKLRDTNEEIKKDNINLKKKLETFKIVNEEMKEILFYKDLKINYFYNIINLLDSTIIKEDIQKAMFSKEKKRVEIFDDIDNGSIDSQKMENNCRKNIDEYQSFKGDKEMGVIKNMNKKIIIKSFVQKIEDINKKIKKHMNALDSYENKMSNILYNSYEIGENSENTNEKNKKDNELLDKYFNCENLSFNENELNLSVGSDGLTTFFAKSSSKDKN